MLWARTTICLVIISTSFVAFSQNLPARYSPYVSSAANTGSEALWQNPAGLAFFGGAESSLSYLYEWNNFGDLNHIGLDYALNFFDILSFAGGFKAQVAVSDLSRKLLGTTLNGIFASSLALGKHAAFGISFAKSHNFLSEKSTNTMIGFGLQARINSYLALGAHYQEVNDGYFSAPFLSAGFAVRPYKEYATLSFDSQFSPKSKDWGKSFSFNPLLSLKTSFHGFALNFSTEFLDVLNGFKHTVYSLGLELNLAHFGAHVFGVMHPSEQNFGSGARIRISSQEWVSLAKADRMWVELTVNSDGSLDEKPQSFARRVLGADNSPFSTLALLRRLKNDPSVEGVIFYFNGFSFGDARAQEWREALAALKSANKHVIVYLDAPSERDYYIANIADMVFMNKESTLSLSRFQATLIYLKDLLTKIGIKAESTAAGKYKSAPRMFTESTAQKEEIEVMNNILQSFYDELLSTTAQARNLKSDELKELFNQGEISALAAKEARLVDDIIFKDEIAQAITKNPEARLPAIANYAYRRFKKESWEAPKRIAIIPITGEIVLGRVEPSIIPLHGFRSGEQDIVDEIEEALSDPGVAGIIVRINSPGGDARAGAAIYRSLQQAQSKKPVVSSMSDVAASAGYMIAAGTSHIIAEPNSITGSIGVFSLTFSADDLAKKVGINSKEISVIENPGPNLLRSMTDKEKLQTQKIIDWYYQNFISLVALGLDIDEKLVQENANGRVWLGKEAFNRKLVNELGGLSQAIDTVKLLADIAPDDDIELELRVPGSTQAFPFSVKLAQLFSIKSPKDYIKEIVPYASPYLKALELYRLDGIPQARLPFNIDWNGGKEIY